MLCDNLNVGVSILDEDLNYQFISNLVYESLDNAQMTYRSVIRCRNVMIS